jgi:DNA-binding response OmpR family regulator
MAEDATRTLVVDDDERVCLTLKETLQRVAHAVTTVSCGEEALELLRETSFDAAVIDLNLSGRVDGLRVLQAIRWRWPDTAVVILTAHGSLDAAITAIREGVDDFLLKPAGPGLVRQTVQRALAGRRSKRNQGATRTARVIRRGGFSVDLDRHLASRDGKPLQLTQQEFRLLVYLMQNGHRVIPPVEMVRAVRGYESESLHEARQVIKWYVHRLRRNVEPDPAKPRHIVNVRGVGYRFIE